MTISFPTTWHFGLLIGWMSAAGLVIGWMWFTIGPLNNRKTQHATPAEHQSEVIVVIAAVASQGAVCLLLLGSTGPGAKVVEAILSVGSVALAWAVVHTMFTTRHARHF